MSTFRCVLLFAAALTAAGCATKTMIAPTPDEMRADLKHLGMVAIEPKPLDSPERPVDNVVSAGLIGAGHGAGGTFVVTAGGFCRTGVAYGCAVGIILGAVLAPVGAVVGAGVGASKSHPSEEVDEAHKAIVAVVDRSRPNADLAAAVRRHAMADYAVTMADIACEGLPERCITDKAAPDRPRYVVQLEYSKFELHALGRIDPDITVRATIEARIFDATTGAPVYRRRWGYRSERHNYFEVAKDKGNVLASLIEDSHEAVATTLLHDLLMESEPVPRRRPRRGTVWTTDGPKIRVKEPESEPEAPEPPDPDRTAEQGAAAW